ncbi:MAG: SusC/RagA family TonB-linked outer membrane protein [Muribaculaceae bacterium]
MKKLFLFLMMVLAVSVFASAQTRTITGTVVDAANDEPLVGVSVIPGTSGTQGVITDIDGNFTIRVAEGVKQLTISYVGYTPQTVAITGNKLEVRLEPAANTLDEIIAVAYGTTKKSAYTGSAAVVKADQLEDALVSNVTNALSGKMSGVMTTSFNGQPGTSANVLIRGVGSINTSTKPLYVVDGLPFDGDIAAIPNSDIESLTVLKDAASTALYGARGANGVILVTTKKGKEGNAKITVDARWGGNSRAIPQYDVITSEAQYLETLYGAIYNTNIYNDGFTHEQAHVYANNTIWPTLGYQTWTVPAGEYLIGTNGKINPNATRGYSDGRYYYIADDWTKESLRHGLRQDYNVSVTGGTQKLSYYLGANYLNDQGIINNSDFERISARAAVDYQAKPWLKLGFSMQYAYTASDYPGNNTRDDATSSGNTFYYLNGLGPVYPMYVRNQWGEIMWNKEYGNPIYDYGDGKTDYGYGLMQSSRTPSGNPAGSLLYDKEEYLADIFDSKWYAVVTPFEGFTLTGTLGYLVDNTRLHQVLNPVYGQFKDMGGQALQYQQRSRSIQSQLLAQYSKSFGNNNFDLLLGYETQDYEVESVQAIGSNLYNPNYFVVDNTIDQKRGYGNLHGLAHRGWLGRLNYNFDNRYFLAGSFRRDGSSRFAPDKRWGTFWMGTAGWDISKEKFMHNFNNIDLLKVKFSYGEQGNDAIGFTSTDIAYADQYRMTGSDGIFSDATLAYKGNPDITWETSRSINAGVDFSIFKGMLQGTVEYYSRTTDDMLMNIPTSPSLGYSSMPMNVGKMRNNGVEIDLNYRPINTKDITWEIFANLTLPNNKVLKIADKLKDENGNWNYSSTRVIREGESLYNLYLVSYAGVEQNPEDKNCGLALYWEYTPDIDADGKPVLDKDGNQMYSEKTTPNYQSAYNTNRKMTGNIMPKGYGGFGTSVKAYGVDLSVQFAFQFGGRIFDSSYQSYMQPGTGSGHTWHKDILNAWTPENTNTDVPRTYVASQMSYASSTSDRFLISSNYVSLNNITLGYTFPAKWTKKLQISSLRIYGAAENVALWSRRKGLDPRQSFISSSNSTYSPIRAISGGIRVEF